MLVYTTPHPKKAFQSGVRPRWTLSRGVYVCVCGHPVSKDFDVVDGFI